MNSLLGKVALITGGSRGIGLAIGQRLAKEGVKIALCAKTVSPNPKLPGTLGTAKQAILDMTDRHQDTECDTWQLDIRDRDRIRQVVDEVSNKWGKIDILVNNASAIDNRGILDLPAKKWDLMNEINVRGTYWMTKQVVDNGMKNDNSENDKGRVLNLSPPIPLNPAWFRLGGTAYTITKYSMSMMALGLSEELRENGIAVNALWPRTAIGTAAVKMLAGDMGMKMSRSPEIMAEAAYWILSQDVGFTGNLLIDDEVLEEAGLGKTISQYHGVKMARWFGFKEMGLLPDLYVGDPEKVAKWMKMKDK